MLHVIVWTQRLRGLNTMLGETSGDVLIRDFVVSDMTQTLELVTQIRSEDDLVQSAHAQFSAELKRPHDGRIRLVATLKGAVVGTMGAGPGPWPSPHVLWADWLVVDADYRQRGIATLLYAEIEAYALRHRRRFLCLDIGNIERERAAFLFHQRNGFQIVGQIPDYWGTYEHLHIMTKCLRSAG